MSPFAKPGDICDACWLFAHICCYRAGCTCPSCHPRRPPSEGDREHVDRGTVV